MPLIPRDVKFYAFFREQAGNICKAAQMLADLFDNYHDVEKRVAEIKYVEHKGDQLTHELMMKLNQTFITPFDREDIHSLGSALDDVLDLVDAAAGRMVTYKVTAVTPGARQLAKVILHGTEILQKAISELEKPDNILDYCEQIQAAQQRVRRREGGIIWHTQGSGKSLTMVWLARWIRENVQDARILIITDRTELDEQIEKVFKGVNEDIYRTKSGQDLIDRLNATTPWLFCSLIHKFAGKDESDIADFIEEVKGSVPPDFKAKGDIYVFVDECHRTQSGASQEHNFPDLRCIRRYAANCAADS